MPIPKVIHQTWKTDQVPDHWKSSHDAWKALEKNGWTYILWTDEMIDTFIQDHFPWFIEKFRAYPRGIQRADTFRYFVLYVYGGIYSDLDIEPKGNFERFYELYKDADVAIAKTKSGNSHGGQNFTNAFMMSAPKSKFWPRVWELVQNPASVKRWKSLLIKSEYFSTMFGTGPGVISDAIATYDGEVRAIPAELVQPGDDKMPKPIDTPESVTRVLEGSSWHGGDAKFWKSMGDAANNLEWIFLAFMIFFFITTVIFWVKWRRARGKKRSKSRTKRRRQSVGSYDPEVVERGSYESISI